jgi:hypothetical protein
MAARSSHIIDEIEPRGVVDNVQDEPAVRAHDSQFLMMGRALAATRMSTRTAAYALNQHRRAPVLMRGQRDTIAQLAANPE